VRFFAQFILSNVEGLGMTVCGTNLNMRRETMSANAGEVQGSYWQKVVQFSRNAKLYLLHVIGMDTIYGT